MSTTEDDFDPRRPPPEHPPCCATCIFYVPIAEMDSGGQCHKNPPIRFHEERFFNFPPVAEEDWCGQHPDFYKWQADRPRKR